MKRARELLLLTGTGVTLAGIGCFDYRLGLIVGGIIVAGGALLAIIRDPQQGAK